MYHIKNTKNNPTPAIGAYCLNMASKLICCAFFLYLIESFLKVLDKSLILSSESPLYKRSSIFLVMTALTSANSSFNLSRLDWAL